MHSIKRRQVGSSASAPAITVKPTPVLDGCGRIRPRSHNRAVCDRHRASATILWSLTLLTQPGGTGAGRGTPIRWRAGNEASRSSPRRSNARFAGALYATSDQPDSWPPTRTQREARSETSVSEMSPPGTVVAWLDSARGRSLNGPSEFTRYPQPTMTSRYYSTGGVPIREIQSGRPQGGRRHLFRENKRHAQPDRSTAPPPRKLLSVPRCGDRDPGGPLRTQARQGLSDAVASPFCS